MPDPHHHRLVKLAGISDDPEGTLRLDLTVDDEQMHVHIVSQAAKDEMRRRWDSERTTLLTEPPPEVVCTESHG
jgi:hypothetical protein